MSSAAGATAAFGWVGSWGFVSSTAFAQGGRLTGTIKDADGKAIKGAVVRALNEAINTTATSTTDDKGRFAIIGMRSGPWTVTVEAPNYVPMRGQAQISASATPYSEGIRKTFSIAPRSCPCRLPAKNAPVT